MRRRLASLGVAAACGLAAWADWAIRTGGGGAVPTALLCLAALSWAWLQGPPGKAAAPPPPGRPRAGGWMWALCGSSLLAVGLGLMGWASLTLGQNWDRNFDRAAPLLVAGVACASVGLWLAAGSDRNRRRWSRGELLTFSAIFAIGAFLRFYRYGDFPPPDGFMAVEEAQSGLRAHQILHQGYRPWEFVLDRWLAVPSFVLFGENLTALRVPFTIVSALTVWAFYALARNLVGRTAALFAAFLFAVSHWHLIYARYAHAVFPMTLVVVVVFWLSARVWRGEALWPYPWIGFLTGTTAYAYAGYRGTPLFVGVLGCAALAVSVFRWRRSLTPGDMARARRHLLTRVAGWGVALAVFVGTVWPLWPLLRQQPQYYVEAANRATLNEEYYTDDLGQFLRLRLDRAAAAAGIFNHRGDTSPTTNIPGEPMLDPLAAVLFMFGLAYSAVWPRYRLQGYFLFVFLTLFFFGTIFPHNLDVRRLQGLIPLVFLFAAYAVDALWRDLRRSRAGRWLGTGLLIALALFAFRENWNFYFRRMINDARVRVAFHTPYTAIAHYYRTLKPTEKLVLVGDVAYFFLDSDYAWWRGPGPGGRHTTDLMPVLSQGARALGVPVVHVLLEQPFEVEEGARWLSEVRGARCEPYVYPPGSHLRFMACRVDRGGGSVTWVDGFRSRYFRGSDRAAFLERVQPAIGFALTPDACRLPQSRVGGACRAVWEGQWAAPASGGELVLETRNAEAVLLVDGERRAEVFGTGANGTRLSGGPHRIRVEAAFGESVLTGVRLRIRRPGGSWGLLVLGEPHRERALAE